MNLTDQPAEIFIQQLTYLPFKDVISACQTNARSLNYCTHPQYNEIWKQLIDNTFESSFDYVGILEKVWQDLHVPDNTYNYLVYTNLIKYLDPVTQLRIYYKQGDMKSFNSHRYKTPQRFIAYYLVGDIDAAKKLKVVRILSKLLDGRLSQLDKNIIMILMAEKGSPLGVSLMVEKGANVRASKNEALQRASSRGNLNVVKYLLEHGADVNAVNDNALLNAIRFNHIRVVKYLVEHGAKNLDRAIELAKRLGQRNNILEYLQKVLKE